MTDWLKLHTNLLDSAKVQRLDGALFKTWVNLLCLAKRHGCDGDLPGDASDIAWALRADEGTVTEHIELLIESDFVTRDGGVLSMHDWVDWQGKSTSDAAERQRRYRAKLKAQKTRDGDVDVTASERVELRDETRDVTGDETRDFDSNVTRDGDVRLQSRVDKRRVEPRDTSRSARRKPETPFPDYHPWKLDELREKYPGINVERELIAFRDHALSVDRRARDWDAAFRTWLNKAKPTPGLLARANGTAPAARSDPYDDEVFLAKKLKRFLLNTGGEPANWEGMGEPPGSAEGVHPQVAKLWPAIKAAWDGGERWNGEL